MKRELARFADRAGENQKRDEGRARPDREQAGGFEAALAGVIKQERAGIVIEPEHSKEESEIANPRRDKGFLGGGGGARLVNPETDEQVGREADKLPRNKEEEEAVRDDD